MIHPVDRKLVQVFGFGFKQKYPNTPQWGALRNQQHLGQDYIVATGSPIMAVEDSFITKKIGIQMGLYLEGVGSVTTRYGHLSKVLKTGKVIEGDIIGLSGNSGTATNAPHCHLDLRRNGSSLSIVNFFDPMKLLKWKTLEIKPTNMEITKETFISNARIFNRGNFETNLTIWNHINIDYYWGLFQKNPEKYEQILDSLFHNIADIKKKQGLKYMDNDMNWIGEQVSSTTATACAEERVKTQNRVKEEIKAKLLKFVADELL